jgi:hypothetical protein
MAATKHDLQQINGLFVRIYRLWPHPTDAA